MYIVDAQKKNKSITIQFEEGDVSSLTLESYDDGYNALRATVRPKDSNDVLTISYAWKNKDEIPPFVMDLKNLVGSLT